ncbi:EF-hand pair protein (macronuclear) [Tetrahymena thermophila SB210]|uniref:EF-hand pair protein n=1 Tax=Tetrahymena thermophila (strain SB210) TaxID=312017 RepID=I7LTF9_TETTS|nr:EF-hand pair protein [Tetrahymena thermophila SB210]EAR85171.1 EF-hand pair protein [Tetrahymena thermophila SB210]|eukprot:XP_001032834.1 EF-hand pair protein [Tetrahymena thermophila SB210]
MTQRSNKVEVIHFQLFDAISEEKLNVARHIFAEKDSKGQGYLSPDVVSQIIQQAFTQTNTKGFKSTPDDVKQFMKQIKSTRQKELTYYEFESYFLGCLARTGHKVTQSNTILRTNRKFNPQIEIQLNVARQQFAKFDTDKSGNLDSNEVYNLIVETHQLIGMQKDTPSEEEVKYYIELADTNKDGVISIQEYEDLFLMNLKKNGKVVIQYRVVNNKETCEKLSDEEYLHQMQSSAKQSSQNIIVKNVYHDDAESKLNIAKRQFIELDKDKSGKLDQEEVANLINTTFANTGVSGYKATPEDVKLYLQKVDTNKDGKVSFEEYEKYVIYCLDKAGVNCSVKSNFIKSRRSFNPEVEMQLDAGRKFFAQFDTDRSGYLEENEIYALIAFTYKDLGIDKKPTADEVQKYIQSADTNNDGRISIQEFEDFVLQNYKSQGTTILEYSIPEVTEVVKTSQQGNVSVIQSIKVTKITTVTTRTINQVDGNKDVSLSQVFTSTHTSTSENQQESEESKSKQLDEPLVETKKVNNLTEGIEQEREEIKFVQSMIRQGGEESCIKEEQVQKSFDELNVVVKNDNQVDLSSSDDENIQKQVQNEESEEKQKKACKNDEEYEDNEVKRNKKPQPSQEKQENDEDHCDLGDENEESKQNESKVPYVKPAHRQNLALIGVKNVYDPQVETRLDAARRLFIQHDVNKSGSLNPEEVATLITALFSSNGIEGYQPTPEDVRLYIQEVDTNKDGLIQYQEFETYVIKCLEKVGIPCEVKQTIVKSNRRFNPEAEMYLDVARKEFAKCDSDKSGYLEENEIYTLIKDSYAEMGILDYQPTEEDVKYYIQLADTDNDGKISIIEFEDLIILSLKQSGMQVIQYKQYQNAESDENQETVKRAPANEHFRRGKPIQKLENTEQVVEEEVLQIEQKEQEEQLQKDLQQAVEQEKVQEQIEEQEKVQELLGEQEKVEDNSEQKQDQEPVCKHVIEPAEQISEQTRVPAGRPVEQMSSSVREPAGRPVLQAQEMNQSSTLRSSKIVIIEETSSVTIEPAFQRQEKPKRASFPSIVIKKVYHPEIEEKLQIAKRLFVQSDKDQNGELDPDEVAVLIINTFEDAGIHGYKPTVQDVKDYMEVVDTDKNGRLSFEEYENYVISCFEKAGLKCDVKDTIFKSSRRFNPQVELKLDVARRLFAKYDTDKSGELEENEVYGIISDTYRNIGITDFRPTVDDVRMWIQMADTDNNGSVSIFEYENLILSSLEKAGIEIKRFTKISEDNKN